MRALFITIIALTVLYGCGSTNVRDRTASEPAADTLAIELVNAGNYAQAAVEYMRLAERYDDSSDVYQLSAASAYIQNRDFDQADAIINQLEPDRSEAGLLAFKNILLARIAMARDQTDLAETLLDFDIPQDATDRLLSDWHATRAEMFEMQNRHLDAAVSRIMLSDYLENSAAIEDNTSRIWDHLGTVTTADITRNANTANEKLRPWIELAAISKSLIARKSDLEKAINNWTAAYPYHPANPLITSRLLTASKSFHTLPGHIALLLPLSGVYESFAERIRDGFLAAWFNHKTYKPEIRVYNTDGVDINEIYQTAVDNGADFIVGPLEKEAVRTLAEMQPVPVRTLALNQTDSRGNLPSANTGQLAALPDLLQFGLPPEDEAREVAKRAILEGHTRVLIITPTDDFGVRVFNAFSEEWTRLGGRILERVNYENRTDDFIAPVKQLLNIDSSEARIALLRQRLGRNINATSRLRNDADFIFMVASNQTAIQIVPHLRFFRADSIPIYAISSIYNGKPNPLADVDLNGVEFVDMPWLINSRTDIRQQITQGWQEKSTISPRYYAFGVDAFRLVPLIGQLALDRNFRYSGETGQLYMSGDGVIHRNLAWARFVDGQPQAIEPGRLR